MLQSKIFAKTMKEAPKDETSTNARLLEQAGYVQKVLAGVYNFLPLGNRVLRKIENIVCEEMDKLGSEILMPGLQPKENWVKTGRYDSVDILFKVESQHGNQYVLGPTHEEIVAPAGKRVISSYRDLPFSVYQIQTKFRDEARAKSGLLRGREFRMKDMYSFHATQEDLDQYHEQVAQAYLQTFSRLGVKAILTEASGGSFSKYSYEFQAELPEGEDLIYVCEKCGLAKNKEIYSGPEEECTNCGKTTWRETHASEIGNIFKLGTKFTEPFEITYLDKDGNIQPVVMGCYGIGTSRLIGVIAELFNDEHGLKWPVQVAPFQVHLLPLPAKTLGVEEQVAEETARLQQALQSAGIEVLLDDRDETAGVKFKDADLIGIPYRVVVSEKSLAANSVELKARGSKESELVELSKAVEKITNLVRSNS